MRLVVGLRNPGPEYEGTRHNIGFETVVRLLSDKGETLGRSPGRVRAQVSQVGDGEERTVYAAPTTFMNESGGAVRSALTYWKIAVEDLLVVHDDIDLPFGRLRVQVGGGSGGHNGVRSVESALRTREFSRLKIGVGRPPGSMDPSDFVLRRFRKAEEAEVEAMIGDAAAVIERWVTDRAKAQEMAALRSRDG